jgi:hypothetical protein
MTPSPVAIAHSHRPLSGSHLCEHLLATGHEVEAAEGLSRT